MVVREEAPAAEEPRDLEDVGWRLRHRDLDDGGCGAECRPRDSDLVPGDDPRRERRRKLAAGLVEQRRDVVVTLRRPADGRAQLIVVGTIQDDRIDEPRDGVAQPRIEQCRADPQQDQAADLARAAQRRPGRARVEERDADEGSRHQDQQRQRAFQEDVGEREREVLIEDGEGEGHRRVMAQELDGPRRVALVKLTEVQRRHRENRQRRRPQRAPLARLAARHRGKRHDEHDERVRQQSHRDRRRNWRAAPRREHVECGGDAADGVRDDGDRPFRFTRDPIGFATQH